MIQTRNQNSPQQMWHPFKHLLVRGFSRVRSAHNAHLSLCFANVTRLSRAAHAQHYMYLCKICTIYMYMCVCAIAQDSARCAFLMHLPRVWHARIPRKCCAHLSHEMCAPRDVSFGHIYITTQLDYYVYVVVSNLRTGCVTIYIIMVIMYIVAARELWILRASNANVARGKGM
jgi:hypothetical protein